MSRDHSGVVEMVKSRVSRTPENLFEEKNEIIAGFHLKTGN